MVQIMRDHCFDVIATHHNVILHRYSFVGDPTKKNFDGDGDFLFGALDALDMRNRDDREFFTSLKEKGARFFIVLVSECDQVVSNGGCIFYPEDVIEYIEE